MIGRRLMTEELKHKELEILSWLHDYYEEKRYINIG